MWQSHPPREIPVLLVNDCVFQYINPYGACSANDLIENAVLNFKSVVNRVTKNRTIKVWQMRLATIGKAMFRV